MLGGLHSADPDVYNHINITIILGAFIILLLKKKK